MVSLNEKSKGVLIRSRVKHVEENEKCTRYFFKKLYKAKPAIDTLINEEGKEVKSTQEILKVAHSFYTNLYKEQSMDEETVESFISKLTQKLDPEDSIILDESITLEEITRAMESMQDNKSPGMDGLPKEYYQAFWEQLSPSLCKVYKEAWDKGVWSTSMNTGAISLLWKKGTKKNLRNWRPLTLLGVDIKILSKALYFRLQTVVSKLVGTEQTCGIQGRKMTDSLAIIRDSYLYRIDLEKAFDNVNHMFLMKVLEILGFGEGFRRWIHVLYSSCIGVKAGVRQGCPLSPTLFILVMEPLACALRANELMKGLTPPGSGGLEIKFSMYMDDITLPLFFKIFNKVFIFKQRCIKSPVFTWRSIILVH
uniref:Reverse transcriptase domain-containing protein n=1 Tax=Haplochromis burtoni TaxID=8153 RepID=A0A3Q2WQW7_HAPBU